MDLSIIETELQIRRCLVDREAGEFAAAHEIDRDMFGRPDRSASRVRRKPII